MTILKNITSWFSIFSHTHACKRMQAHALAFCSVNQSLNASACACIFAFLHVKVDSKRIKNNSYGLLYTKGITLLVINTLMQAHANACKRMRPHAIKKEIKRKGRAIAHV
jgi:hypothetical protein